MLITLLLHVSLASADFADCYLLSNALDGPLNKKECIFKKEDITSMNELRPIDFWKRIEKYVHNIFTEQSDYKIMEHPLFRIYFFGNFYPAIFNSNITKGFEDSAAYLLSLSDKKQKDVLGHTVSKEIGNYVVADDIPFQPILRGHGHYSNKYYPRRMGDYALTFLKAYYLSKDKNYKKRFLDMIEYLIYSQFKKDGYNQFINQFCNKENYSCLPVDKKVDVSAWEGGFDFLFDWNWKDGYGYQWKLHEPDHHVNSINALALVKGFELTNNKKYLNSAYNFVYNQIPRYGYHTGIWNKKRYYWTEYNPSGEANPTDDATDNVQSLVAHIVAVVGYYTKDVRMLEYARGLLWYNLREITMDSRWFYDGAENKMNARRSVSHDSTTLKSAIEALPYLIKAGMEVKYLVDGYYNAFLQYLYFNDPYICKMIWHVGSRGANKSAKDDPTDLAQLSPFRGIRSWKTFSHAPEINQPVRVTYFFQFTDKDILMNKKEILLLDRLFYELPRGSELIISRYSPDLEMEETISNIRINEKSTKIYDMLSNSSRIEIGDILTLSFEWIPVSENSLNYTQSNFELLITTNQDGQKRVQSSKIIVDPKAGCTTELFRDFYKNYFLPRKINVF